LRKSDRILFVTLLLSLLELGAVLCQGQGGVQEKPHLDAAAQEQIRQLTASLPATSMWRTMMEHQMKGDGIHRPWMDQMRKDGIKLAVLTFEFTWTNGGKELGNWTLVREQYFRDYDKHEPVSDAQQLDLIRRNNLLQPLEAVALERARTGLWVDGPAEQTGTGHWGAFLADNEWLPVQVFPWYGRYDAGTTPLMHAAVLGDVPRIKKLLKEGAAVDLALPDGMTALMYAAGSGNPMAVEALLSAGADVRRKTRTGDDALMNAAAGNDPRVVSLLLKAGADPNSRDSDGESAHSIAVQRRYPEVAKLLEEAGARK
jgi:hypothetical protein